MIFLCFELKKCVLDNVKCFNFYCSGGRCYGKKVLKYI